MIVERCRFIGCRSGEGGTLFVAYYYHLQIAIKDSHFISNYGLYGAALLVGPIGIKDCLKRNTCAMTSQITIENSIFSKNEAELGSALYLVGNYNNSFITLNKVILDLNIAKAAAVIYGVCTLKILQSRIVNTEAVVGSGAGIRNVKILEVVDSVFEGNYYRNRKSGPAVGGGAITFSSDDLDFTSDHSVLIVNTTFNSCSAQHGGAINFDIETDIRVRVKIKNSRFTNNFAVKNGGAIWFSLAQDTQGDLECIKQDKILKVENNDAIAKEPS